LDRINQASNILSSLKKIAAYLHQIIKKEATTKRSSDHGSFFKITALIYSVAQLK